MVITPTSGICMKSWSWKLTLSEFNSNWWVMFSFFKFVCDLNLTVLRWPCVVSLAICHDRITWHRSCNKIINLLWLGALEAVHLNHHVTKSRLCPDESFNQLGIVEHHELKHHAKTLYFFQGHGHSCHVIFRVMVTVVKSVWLFLCKIDEPK